MTDWSLSCLQWWTTQSASICLYYHTHCRQGGPAAHTLRPSTHTEPFQAALCLTSDLWPPRSLSPTVSSGKKSCRVHPAAAAVRIWVDQDLDGDSADGVERAEDVESWCGTETEDGLPFVQDYEGLQETEKNIYYRDKPSGWFLWFFFDILQNKTDHIHTDRGSRDVWVKLIRTQALEKNNTNYCFCPTSTVWMRKSCLKQLIRPSRNLISYDLNHQSPRFVEEWLENQ